MFDRRCETLEQAWARREAYLADKTIGLPKATEAYTVGELQRMGFVGVYRRKET